MKTTRFVVAVAALSALSAVLTLAPTAAQAQSLRCKNDAAQVGDGKASVLKKCGEPVTRDSFCKPVPTEQQKPQGSSTSPVTVNVNPCEQVDEWTYNPGRGQFLTTLRFESGVLKSMKYGDRVN